MARWQEASPSCVRGRGQEAVQSEAWAWWGQDPAAGPAGWGGRHHEAL